MSDLTKMQGQPELQWSLGGKKQEDTNKIQPGTLLSRRRNKKT
jgi:hypothetical protein